MNDKNTDLAEQAHYLYLKWLLTPDEKDIHMLKYREYLTEFDKYKIYYQSSKYIALLEKEKKKYENKSKYQIEQLNQLKKILPQLIFVQNEGKDNFNIGKTEITQAQWKTVMGDNPSKFKGENNPIENISWYDAIEFCNKLSIMAGLQICYSGSGSSITYNFSANGYRLPTNAEWEYAAKGGVQSRNYEYSGSNNADEVSWNPKNSDKTTHPVGEKQEN
ncbi:MAG: formylglycine-generating enzyme family protein [Bacteroidales bacterium]|nr:formylglycine-generating enzyme family protein [Bacteroidales bacterium]